MYGSATIASILCGFSLPDSSVLGLKKIFVLIKSLKPIKESKEVGLIQEVSLEEDKNFDATNYPVIKGEPDNFEVVTPVYGENEKPKSVGVKTPDSNIDRGDFFILNCPIIFYTKSKTECVLTSK